MLTVEEQIIENPFIFGQIEPKTEELALLAVNINPKSLLVIPEPFQTFEVCRFAINLEINSFPFIKNPTKEICDYALTTFGQFRYLLSYIKNPITDPIIAEKIILDNSCSGYFKQISLEVWTIDFVYDVLKKLEMRGHSVQNDFVSFIKTIGFKPEEFDSKNKILLLLNFEKGINISDITDEDIKYFLMSDSRDVTRLCGRYNSIELSPIEFYKCKSKSLALKYAKTITDNMIRITACNSLSKTMDILTARGMLDGNTLIKILQVAYNNLQSIKGTDCAVTLKKIVLTNDQLEIIRNSFPKMLEYLSIDKIFQNTKPEESLFALLKKSITADNPVITKALLIKEIMNPNLVSEETILTIGQLKQIFNDENEQSKQNASTGARKFDDGYNMFRSKNPSNEEFIEAVTKNGEYLQYVPYCRLVSSLCVTACLQTKEAIKWVPENIKNEVLDKVAKIVEPKYYRVICSNKMTKKNCEIVAWNLDEECAALRKEYPNTLSFKHTASGFKFYDGQTKLKSIIIMEQTTKPQNN